MTFRPHLIRLSALAISLLTSGLALADAYIDPKLVQQMSAADPGDELQVVISYKQSGPITAEQLDGLQEIGITQGVTMRTLPIAGAFATSEEVLALAERADVASIYWNAPLRYFNQESRKISSAKRAVDNPGDYGYGVPFSGTGVTILVNDTGIDATHADLAYGSQVIQNVLGQTNAAGWGPLQPAPYVSGLPNTDLSSSHGTHVAGILAGTGLQSSGLYRGVAPGANLVGYGSGATLFMVDAIAGMDYAATNKDAFEDPLRIVSNAWGTTGEFNELDPVNIATYELYKVGIINVFAAGNDGTTAGANNPYGQAPWVISVAAADKRGTLASFSSRGTVGRSLAFSTIDGNTWTSFNEPAISATGVDVVSTRAPMGSQTPEEQQHDADTLDPAHVPYYTHMTGTSMAAPHVAGIIALMIDANPNLTPMQVRDILDRTATNLGGRPSWEAGAGHVNAYAALAEATGVRDDWGLTVNSQRTFNSNARLADGGALPFSIAFASAGPVASESIVVGDNVATVTASADVGDNTVALVLTDPSGVQYFSAIAAPSPAFGNGRISTSAPGKAGTWTLTVRGFGSLDGTGLDPEDVPNGYGDTATVSGDVSFTNSVFYTGLADIGTVAGRKAIEFAVANRFADGYADGTFHPGAAIKRAELAQYLVMGANIRQALPLNFVAAFNDVPTGTDMYAYAASVTATGGALRDLEQTQAPVMGVTPTGKFQGNQLVTRVSLAYSLVQSLALESEAQSFSGPVTVFYMGRRLLIEDEATIPVSLRGYVQQALDLGLITAKFTTTQGPSDPEPVVHAVFEPVRTAKRSEFAVSALRYQSVYRLAQI